MSAILCVPAMNCVGQELESWKRVFLECRYVQYACSLASQSYNFRCESGHDAIPAMGFITSD